MEKSEKVIFLMLLSCVILAYCLSARKPAMLKYSECGPRSLFTVVSLIYPNTKYDSLCLLFDDYKDNIPLSEIAESARKSGCVSEIRRMSALEIRQEKTRGVLHIDGSHFVGLVGQDSQTFHIMETGYEGPPRLERWSDGDLMARWDGVILVISKPKDGTIPPVAARNAALNSTAAH
jgi:ABC-type bacteriocin/lantibiotic exporter with double-glycine peptidase domain